MNARWYAKWTVKAVTPPILVLAAKWVLIALGLRKRDASAAAAPPEPPPPAPALPEWEYVPEGWARETKGWAVDAVAQTYRAKWDAFVEAIQAPKPLGVYYETAELRDLDHSAHNMLVSFTYVVALAARGRDRLSVLDWGGGLGHYHELARAAVPGVELDYHVKEVAPVAAEGRAVSPAVTFHDDDACLGRTYDLVFVSGALQYEVEWEESLRRFAAATARYLYVTRLPVALHAESFVVLQRAYAYGYDTEYLGWVIARDELLRAAERSDLRLERELLLAAWFSAAGAPEDPVEHRGFLFARARET